MRRSIERAGAGIRLHPRLAALLVIPTMVAACSSGVSSGASGGPPSPASASSSAAATEASCASLAGLPGLVSEHGTKPLTGQSANIEAGDSYFQATCLTDGPSGGAVSVTVTNTGSALHNFSVSDLGIDEDVAAGESVTLKVALPTSGALPFFCKYHVGAGMQGAFVVG